MAEQFRAISLYLNNAKVAELEELKIKVMTNGEQVFGDGAVLGETDGIVSMEGSFNVVHPVAGNGVDIDDLVVNQTPVQFGYLKGGQIWKADGKIIDGETTSTSKSGVVKGVYNFRAGTPNVIG